MKRVFAPTMAVAAVALGLAGVAVADPFDNGGADATVQSLKGEGYNVQVNGGASGVPLSRCSVSGINPVLNESDSLQAKQHTLVTVDVVCPST